MNVEEQVLEYFKGDTLATDVFLKKYSHKDKNNNPTETPKDLWQRLAKEFTRIEKNYIEECDGDYSRLSQYGQDRYLTFEHEDGVYDYIYKLFKDFKYIIPGGSVLAGLGANKPVSLSNCFVIDPPEDNIESIFNTTKSIAQISKRRGGVGFDISNLRPGGASVNNAANSSTGAVSFLDLYSKITDVIGQGGRRAALMITMDINHPDIEEFITIKNDLTKITGANLSIKLNKDFLDAVEEDKDYYLTFPCKDNGVLPIDLAKLEGTSVKEFFELIEYNKLYTYKLSDKSTIKYYKRIKAKELWNKIINSAWGYAEPGILFWNNVLNYDPTSVYKELTPCCTNPCSELPLAASEACKLMCVNLKSLIKNPYTKEAGLDLELAYKIFYECTVLADNLVDLEIEAVDRILIKINPKYQDYINKPCSQGFSGLMDCDDLQRIINSSDEFKLWWKIREIGLKGRRIGNEITGYADMLAMLGLPYGDKEITDQLFRLKLEAELDASIDMAILRGAFPLWNRMKEYSYIDGSTNAQPVNKWYKFILNEYPNQVNRMVKYGRRNAGISTLGPTGSLSILAGNCTSGIEPMFQPHYTRRKKCNTDEKPDFIDQNGVGFKEYLVIHPGLKEWMNKTWDYNEVMSNHISKENVQLAYEQSPYYKQSSADLDYNVRLETQALIQKYITSAIKELVA